MPGIGRAQFNGHDSWWKDNNDDDVVPLKHIFNLSLLSGVFPDSMKIARVIPLFKTGNTREFSNYRPISLLPQFSKILDKMYHSRLMAFIDINQILYKSQYGFRKQLSTSLAIIELVEEITNSLDNHESTVGVFIDQKRHSIQLITASSLKSFIIMVFVA